MSDKPSEEKAAAPEAHASGGGGGISPGMFFGVIGGMVLILLGGGFGLFQYVIMPQITNMRAPVVSEESDHAAPAAAEHGAKPKAAEHGSAEKAKEGGHGEAKADAAGSHSSGGSSSGKSTVPFVLNEIKVNVAGTRAGRILQVSLSFTGPEDVVKELTDNEYKVTDLVLQILARKTMEELTSPTAYGMIRTEIITNVNAFLTEGKIDGVSFTQFLIQ